jgi:intracellular sulfur oxidation DsrE/DsrF family protein
MPCDSKPFNPNQTLAQRKEQVIQAVANLSEGISSGRIRVKVGPQGAIVFDGWNAAERMGITDACAYRRIATIGNSITRMKIAQAEQMAGRSVNRQVIGQGAHSHDGGVSWHSHKG